MALNIKNPETDQLARRLSALTDENITTAIKTALRERIEREERTRGKAWSRSCSRSPSASPRGSIGTAERLTRSLVTTSAACPDHGRGRFGAASVFFMESDASRFLQALQQTPYACISAANFLEIALIIDNRDAPEQMVDLDLFLAEAGIEIVPVTAAWIARDAYRRFGRATTRPA